MFVAWQVVAGEKSSFAPELLKRRTVLAANFAMYWVLVPHIYFLVLHFQARDGVSVIASAADMLPLVITCSVLSIAAGIRVTKIGYFTPPAVVGTSLTLIGAGLRTILDGHTSTAKWAGLQILVGVGFGLSLQQGCLAMQVVLDPKDVAAGT